MFFLLHPASCSAASASSSKQWSTRHHQHNTINTTPSTQHHDHNTINTTPSTRHHLHNIFNSTPSTLHHQKQHHQHNIYTTSSTLRHLHYIIKKNHQHTIYTTSSSLHHIHYIIKSNIINTTSSTRHNQDNTINTKPSAHHHQHNTINTTLSTQRHQHNTINTTSVSFCVAGSALGAPPQTSAEVRRRLSTMGTGCFCLAGAALGGPQSHFAWQAQHSEHFSSCSTISPFCTSTHHHLHNTIYTTSSTQHHLHSIIKHNIITTHHLHYIITFCAALGALPSYPFCLVLPLLLFFVVVSSLFCFVDLFHTWMCEDIVNMWGFPVLSFWRPLTARPQRGSGAGLAAVGEGPAMGWQPWQGFRALIFREKPMEKCWKYHGFLPKKNRWKWSNHWFSWGKMEWEKFCWSHLGFHDFLFQETGPCSIAIQATLAQKSHLSFTAGVLCEHCHVGSRDVSRGLGVD